MSEFEIELNDAIGSASERVGFSWPLYSFVTSNPLAGFEEFPFQEAIQKARGMLGGRGYPSAHQFRQAYENGRIPDDRIEQHLTEHGIESTPREALDQLEEAEKSNESETNGELSEQDRTLNQILEKWLSSFLDEGQAHWTMPNREQGFYNAWYQLAPYDHHITDSAEIEGIPSNKYNAIRSVLDDVPTDDWVRVLTYHLTALPGWVGYIKQRNQRNDNDWAELYPIDLVDYTAVRLVLADQLGATVVPEKGALEPREYEEDPIRESFLRAWEEGYRNHLIERLNFESNSSGSDTDQDRPDAQMVFCIDTRSEIIRRHIESTGNYDTHGYAGFFGVPVQHQRFNEKTVKNACPPIVEPQHVIRDVARHDDKQSLERYQSFSDLKHSAKKGLKHIKDNIGSAFSYVEFSGVLYGLDMLVKTLAPQGLKWIQQQTKHYIPDYNDVTKPDLGNEQISHESHFPLKEQVDYAQAAFETMGWTTFAPLVMFTGHTSETSNNPFDSSLRCGACSGQSGTPNARILAAICNRSEVRDRLRERGMEIPEDTVFIAAQHNTTTDEITIYDRDIPKQHEQRVQSLRDDLETARKQATEERVQQMSRGSTSQSVRETERRAADWAETRPEWGLAGNASFFVGPNRLRDNVDLEGRAFLHSYDWREDPDGESLADIMAGPVIVCQWINHQYYFASIDNGMWGSGSKISHNPVGNFGVLQGNGGDLMSGLPLQSLMKTDTEFQHEPLRILNVIHAPLDRVQTILDELPSLDQLVKNNWIGMTVIDPTEGNEVIHLHRET
ncbi:MAG: DUF2309 domain-containing protein [bacterium]